MSVRRESDADAADEFARLMAQRPPSAEALLAEAQTQLEASAQRIQRLEQGVKFMPKREREGARIDMQRARETAARIAAHLRRSGS